MTKLLTVKNLKTELPDSSHTKILTGVNLSINQGEIHALMGQNGSGKSTLAQTIMGSPFYRVVEGDVELEGQNLSGLDSAQRSKLGIFLSFQTPVEIGGVNIGSFLRLIHNKSHDSQLSPIKFRELAKPKLELLGLTEDIFKRYLNDGFSGGEKKRLEMLQMLVLEPKLVILDEVDSGLDVDALKIVGDAVTYLHEKTNCAVLVITHYSRLFKYLKPQFVHVLADGKIAKSGPPELVDVLEEKGYAGI